MSNVVVKLFTRPVVGGRRTWVEVNPKLDYPHGTVFYLRWLPKGRTNYRVKSLRGKMGLKLARIVCAFEPPVEDIPAVEPPQPVRSYELLTREFIDIINRTQPLADHQEGFAQLDHQTSGAAGTSFGIQRVHPRGVLPEILWRRSQDPMPAKPNHLPTSSCQRGTG